MISVIIIVGSKAPRGLWPSPEHFLEQFFLSSQFHTLMASKLVLTESNHRSLGRPLVLLPIGLYLKILYFGKGDLPLQATDRLTVKELMVEEIIT
ncbi:hypothetical protein TNIN_337361 [Trichonephila inaurata madagascariensis]|uniref:Uncharacterized protein n=1 Tax=Trichonephila inaurata madagascariensis TaxID=2747483 RepID=A0A8X6XC82_9ARAC|nr:hypothetical protein TNIN_262361 [Trichonephila inaurata madagascariensis]GFY60450.1 hypothetical protein TNIN_337361 [Trichonephila inaurata madagascariensis]